MDEEKPPQPQKPSGEAGQREGEGRIKPPYKALGTDAKRLADWVPQAPELPDEAWLAFVADFQKEYGIDLGQYKEKQMRRRINMMLTMYSLSDYPQLLDLLKTDPKAKTKFFDRLTINVSEFFRNPERWEALEKEVLSPLAAKQKEIRIFCAGCSTGEEPYTLAVMALHHQWHGVSISAWDIDQDALNQAQRGSYLDRQVKQVPPAILSAFFEQEEENFLVKPEVKKLVKFERHNLLEDPFCGPFDLILCRNVVIYFTEDTKDKLYARFVAALKPGGHLFVGSTERVVNATQLGLDYFSPFIYHKK